MSELGKILKMWVVSSLVVKWGLIVLGLGVLTGSGIDIDISIGGGQRHVTERGQ